MRFELPEGANGLEVVSRMFFLAYNASQVVGMGHLQARDGVTEEQVMGGIMDARDYPGLKARAQEKAAKGNFSADYVYGRMMKCYIELDGNVVQAPDRTPTPDYQSWCRKYPTYQHLYEAALSSLDITVS